MSSRFGYTNTKFDRESYIYLQITLGVVFAKNLDLEGEHVHSWNVFQFELSRANIRLKKESNVLLWEKQILVGTILINWAT